MPLPFPSINVERIDWESLLGRNWLAIIGALALALGIGFFLLLSFENEWIDERGRILLGIAAGAALLGVGEYMQRRVPTWSQAVTAGGAATLYISIYAAYALYEMVPPVVAFLALGVVVALAVALAVRYDSRVIGFLGILGAFIAPILPGTERPILSGRELPILLAAELPDVRLILPYIVVIDLGIFAVASVRNWRWFTLAGWLGSYGLFSLGYWQFQDTDPRLFQAGLTIIFLLFTGATTLFHVLWRRIPDPLDMALVVGNSFAFFGLSVLVLRESYAEYLWLIALALSALYFLIAYAAYARPGAPLRVAMIALPTAIVFLTIAIPLRFTSPVWLTMAWAAEGAVLVWSGFMLRRALSRGFGLGILTLAAGYLLVNGVDTDAEAFTVVLNAWFIVYAFVITALYAAAYLYHRYREFIIEEYEGSVRIGLLAAANVLTVILLTLQVFLYFDDAAERAGRSLGTDEAAEAGFLLTLTLVWSLYAAALLTVGLWRNNRFARIGGLALMALAAAKLLWVDTFTIEPDASVHTLILNYHFLTNAAFVAVLAVIAWAFRATLRQLPQQEFAVFRWLPAAAAALALWTLSLEAIHYFAVQETRLDADQQGVMLLTLTLVWSLYAAALLAVGLWRNIRFARLGGLALMALTGVKLLWVDTLIIEPDPDAHTLILNYHFLVNAAVVAVLAVIAWVFRSPLRQLPEEELAVFRWLPAAAAALALWTLSLEAIHYFAVQETRLSVDQTDAMQLTLTVLWAAYGIGAIAVGIVLNDSRVRLAGLGVLAVAVVKLFAFDVFQLEAVYRVAAFVTLGILLLATGLAYQRYSNEVKGFLLGRGADGS